MRQIASVVILFFVFMSASYAQHKISLPFAPQYDENADILIGMQYSYSMQSHQLMLAKDWQQMPIDYDLNDISYLGDLKSISSAYRSTLSVGIPIDFRVNENVYFNLSPSFMFMNDSEVKYESMDNDIEPISRMQRQDVGANIGGNFNAFEIPLSIKFRSDEKYVGKFKQGRYRAYLLGGVRLTRWISIEKEYRDILRLKKSNQVYPDNIIIKPEYVSWEAGFGVDIFLEHFKVSPEIKFNQSFGNILDKKHPLAIDNKFMAPLEKSYLRNVYLSLTFQ